MQQQLKQHTVPIHLQSIEQEILQAHYDAQEPDLEMEQQLVIDIPTIEHPAVHISPPTGQFALLPQRVVPPPLPLDGQGRPYFAIGESGEPTISLVSACVEHFHKLMQYYPSVIILSRGRYLPFGHMMGAYFHFASGVHIPYVCGDESMDCDIICRGENAYTRTRGEASQ